MSDPASSRTDRGQQASRNYVTGQQIVQGPQPPGSGSTEQHTAGSTRTEKRSTVRGPHASQGGSTQQQTGLSAPGRGNASGQGQQVPRSGSTQRLLETAPSARGEKSLGSRGETQYQPALAGQSDRERNGVSPSRHRLAFRR
jgi:hypothetical protein